MNALLARPGSGPCRGGGGLVRHRARHRHGGAGDLTRAALTFGAFFVIVGLGQMFVITLGPGNVDLSIPATMTLAGTWR